MTLRTFRTRSLGLRLAWAALLALVFQQGALAAYVCPIGETETESAAVMADCKSMSMPDPDAPALCEQHCLREHVTHPELKAPQVPSLALPAFHLALTSVLSPTAQAQFYEDIPTCRSDPPPAQRFCSLQI